MENQIEALKTMDLKNILHEDVWRKLHPATKGVVKILQHLRNKILDMAEVRVTFSSDSITITTYKSKSTIGKDGIEFIRWNGDHQLVAEIRVQRAKVSLPNEVIETVKEQVMAMIEYGSDPDYGLIVYTIEKAITSQQ
jgi:hypothetical protein